MIEFEHVYKSYSDTKAVLTDVSLKIETGELFTLIGSSGCGKTTLLKTINKLNTFEQGELRSDGRRVQELEQVLSKLDGRIDEKTMAEMNSKVDVEGKSAEEVAHQFLEENGLLGR